MASVMWHCGVREPIMFYIVNLDKYTGNMVCSKQLYKEALNHAFDEPKQWEIREINEIMNQCIDRWRYFPNPRMFSEYGRQKGWERENPATDSGLSLIHIWSCTAGCWTLCYPTDRRTRTESCLSASLSQPLPQSCPAAP